MPDILDTDEEFDDYDDDFEDDEDDLPIPSLDEDDLRCDKCGEEVFSVICSSCRTKDALVDEALFKRELGIWLAERNLPSTDITYIIHKIHGYYVDGEDAGILQ